MSSKRCCNRTIDMPAVGDKLTKLLTAKEAGFDTEFKAKFGSLDGPDVPEGTFDCLCLDSSYRRCCQQLW